MRIPFIICVMKSIGDTQWTRLFKPHNIITVQFFSRLITQSEIFMKSGKMSSRSFAYFVSLSGPCKESKMIYIFIIFLCSQLFSDKNLHLLRQESCWFHNQSTTSLFFFQLVHQTVSTLYIFSFYLIMQEIIN